MIIAVDHADARNLFYAGDLAQRHGVIAERGYAQVADSELIVTEVFGIPYAQVEFALALVYLGGGLTADGGFDHGVGIGGGYAVLGHSLLIKVYLQFGLAHVMQYAQILDTLHSFQDVVYVLFPALDVFVIIAK